MLSRRYHDNLPSQPSPYLPAASTGKPSPLSGPGRSPGDLSPAHAHHRARAPFSYRARIAVLSGVRHPRLWLSTVALPRLRRLLSDPIEGLRSGPLCFSARGFPLHAATRIEAADRSGLERLCRYVTRPPLAAGRLQLIDADHLTFRLKAPWSDGTTHLLLSPLELLEKLAALIPPGST